MPRLQGPTIGAKLGVPATKENPRSDFRPLQFDKAIERSHRIAWSRAIHCPCEPINEQTGQPDPNCPRCLGQGWAHVPPDAVSEAEADEFVGELTPYQRGLIRHAAPVWGIVNSFSSSLDAYTQLGSWAFGSARLTMRAGNWVGYQDRIVLLDAVMTYSEVVTVEGSSVPTKYPVESLLHALTSDGESLSVGDAIYADPTGKLIYPDAPGESARLGLHYLTAPTFRVMEWPNTFRGITNRQKLGRPRDTPGGQPIDLPSLSVIRLEHLIDGGGG